MRKLCFLSLFSVFLACCNNEIKENNSKVMGGDSLIQMNNSNTEKINPIEKLHDTSPNEINISHYLTLIHDNISSIGGKMEEVDSLFRLIDSTSLKVQAQFRVDRARLVYLCVIKEKDSAEVLTKTLFKENIPLNWSQPEIDYELFYYLSYIKALKGDCDSAQFYNKLLNTTVNEDPTTFHRRQVENLNWLNSWLHEECNQ